MTDAQQRFWFPCDGEGFAIGDVQNYDPKTENMLVQLHVTQTSVLFVEPSFNLGMVRHISIGANPLTLFRLSTMSTSFGCQ